MLTVPVVRQTVTRVVRQTVTRCLCCVCVGTRCKRAYFVIQATDRVLPVIRWVSELPQRYGSCSTFHLSVSRCRRVCLLVFCCGFVVVVIVVVGDDDDDDDDDDDVVVVLINLFAEIL